MFDRIWHEGLCQVMKNYDLEEDFVQVIQTLYANSNRAVLLINQLGERWLKQVHSWMT